MSTLKSFCRNLTVSSHEVVKIGDVLARSRIHLSRGRYAICATLIQQAENKLKVLGKEKEDERR